MRLSERCLDGLVRCLPRDGILVFEFAEVNRVGKGEDDGPRVERGHDLDNVLGERVLKRVSMAKAVALNGAHLQRAQTEKSSGLDMVDDVHQVRELWAVIVRASKD